MSTFSTDNVNGFYYKGAVVLTRGDRKRWLLLVFLKEY